MRSSSPARSSFRSFAVAVGFGLLALMSLGLFHQFVAMAIAVDDQHDHHDPVGWRYIAYAVDAVAALAVVFLVRSYH